jgi:hypothetical protein
MIPILSSYWRDRWDIRSTLTKSDDQKGMNLDMMVEVAPNRFINLDAALKLNYVTAEEAREFWREYHD